ncbi:hypothetical protein FC70_GL001083 [Paucilactobacillus oligofermentans DSM 15707 = LMG 22743]|uniref:Sugar specific permease n=1 Tax=Paucilactobacillus oligofermentans DSM 15707 = LMG 22743 TaxID=1423778 RepID=A0A0R1RGK4_9LACO|nr:hypothetical protein [Paucilactobacillus oligofermentans]KRL55486.1 hypothetical protein FC70_GL001083 [Paucilactobacillus oligofermentans DSM 15707 = LMG 22743]CUS25529.1 Putative sugar specific permease [Paucilactobacillus oligofermentans DSM 15707 = LMG 22743]
MRQNGLSGRIFFLCFSIIINSFFNALTVATNMGSAVWTASATNLSEWLHFSLGNVLMVMGVIVAVANLLLIQKFDYLRLIRNLLFVFPFSYLLQYWRDWFVAIGVPNLPIYWRIILDAIAIVGIALAVSLYQRANLIIHPNDDLPYILRFKFMHGNSVLSQWTSNIPPILVIIISVIATHTIVAVNIGTVLAIALQGYLIGWGDKYFFPGLKHHLNF